ncbi:uncharacterized protein K489DRAFT_372918 [Dissoconium aciculare CBS 342.82]|uniref:Secreted protein n=1 Tax=Dissoconium aciculare CBS 342.82 TaxID=1314786 RepID=A0A6J3LXE2_9PEZI|nr:uncharacterized protein K489DRAFT_372918 [Dissoconium aciculare CBS 342.82]KAF1820420.1 hypothetical protein K489DRAFT_372918 [Dissoconium aciculare CBS 342.82]
MVGIVRTMLVLVGMEGMLVAVSIPTGHSIVQGRAIQEEPQFIHFLVVTTGEYSSRYSVGLLTYDRRECARPKRENLHVSRCWCVLYVCTGCARVRSCGRNTHEKCALSNGDAHDAHDDDDDDGLTIRDNLKGPSPSSHCCIAV